MNKEYSEGNVHQQQCYWTGKITLDTDFSLRALPIAFSYETDRLKQYIQLHNISKLSFYLKENTLPYIACIQVNVLVTFKEIILFYAICAVHYYTGL